MRISRSFNENDISDEDIEILSNFFDTFIITDARLIHEFESIKNKYNDVITIKIERYDYDN